MQVSPRLPITWVSSDPNANSVNRQSLIKDADGNARLQKRPQIGHAGNHDDYVPGLPWYREFVTQHGNTIFYCLTNGSSDWNVGSDYGQDRMRKARHHGWFMPHECPCALIASGQILPDKVLDTSVRSGQPCSPQSLSELRKNDARKPCSHAQAEIAARLKETKRIDEERAEAFRQQDQAAQATREQTKALVEAMGENQQKQLMALLQAMKGDAPEDEKKKPK